MNAIAPPQNRLTVATEPSALAAILATMAQEVAFHLHEKRVPVAVVIYDYGINHQLHQRGLAIAPGEGFIGFGQDLLTQVAHKIHMTQTFFSPARSYPPHRAWNGTIGLRTAWDRENSFAAQFIATESRPYVPNFEDTLALGVSMLLHAANWDEMSLSRLAAHLSADGEAEEVPREPFDAMMRDLEWLDTKAGRLIVCARELLGAGLTD